VASAEASSTVNMAAKFFARSQRRRLTSITHGVTAAQQQTAARGEDDAAA
jgi:hypothetical protein